MNVLSHGLYDNLLFDGDDKDQERDGVLFNSDELCDYELEINPEEPCDISLYYSRPYYRELKAAQKANENGFLIVEVPALDLKYGKRLVMSEYGISPEKYIEFTPEEKDIIADYHLGVKPNFSLDKISKTYHRVLLDVYNAIHGTSFTKIKQIAKKKGPKKDSAEKED